MEEEDQNLGFLPDHRPSPSLVSLASFSPIAAPSSRRLSSSFSEPSRPVLSARKLAWVSLQGRLVNAEEATSAEAIGGGLSREETLAWEMFTPIQRFLIVAVTAAASSQSRKNRIISQLKRSVELRDQVLSTMQKKLDNLCEQFNNVIDQRETADKNAGSPLGEGFGTDSIKFVDCGCWFCDQHHPQFACLMASHAKRTSMGDEMMHYKMNLANEPEQEERRMSDLSDWASSVTSSPDIQLNNLAIELDVFNLKKECEEKDAIIKELSTHVQSSNVNVSKRIKELEEIIRRKNTIITRLKKDTMVLDQKIMQLTRLRRPSSSAPNANTWQLPAMTDNLLYDMDSTTSPSSSSDSDSPPKSRPQTPIANPHELPVQKNEFPTEQKSIPLKVSTPSALVRQPDWHSRSRSACPLEEIVMNHKYGIISSRQRPLSANGDIKRNRKPTQTASNPKKRWA